MALIFRRKYPSIKNYIHQLSAFCSLPDTVNNEEVIGRFRTSKSNPSDHTIHDIGLFYEIPTDISLEKLFKYGGWNKPFLIQCETFNEACLMIRKPGLEILHYLKNSDYTAPINNYVIYGKPGTGKSLILSYVLHYAYLSGWLIVHVPWVSNWLRKPKEVTNSTKREGFVDLNADATQWLIHFRTQNFNLLKENMLLLQNEYTWNIRDSSKINDTLLSIIDYGISRGMYSSEVIIALLQEIKQLSRLGVIKTIVLIDGINAMFHKKTNIKNDEKILLPPTKVSFINAFLDIIRNDWHNGASVLVCDELALPDHSESELPFYQLTIEGFELLFPFIPIEVTPYSKMEMINQLRYYKDRRWLQNVKGDSELMALSAGNGYCLRNLCAPL